MKYLFKISLLILGFILVVSCAGLSNTNFKALKLADKNAQLPTQILYERIKEIPSTGIAIGQEDATIYGITWKQQEKPLLLQSDFKKVSDKMPAVYGFDLGHLELGNSFNLDTVSFALIKDHVRKLNKKGGIISFSWHLDNPVSGGSSWDTTAAVNKILKGGAERTKYEAWIRKLSGFFKSLKTEDGAVIPVVFRPFHEMNGSWFWWGKGNCTPQEYKELWRQTYYLMEKNNVNNVLYAFAPNALQNPEDFETYYPGDDFVDILGVDIYNYGTREDFINTLQTNLHILKEKSLQKNKAFALTETGNTKPGKDPNWWTNTLFKGIQESGISWVLLWRNARLDHYFSVYPGDISAEDFREFEKLKETLFLNEIEKINYKTKR